MRGEANREAHDEQPRYRQADQHRARHEPTHVQHEDRQRRERHDNGRVDDPLHDDRAQRRRPADALAVAEVVAPHQLPKARRQHVVGEVADQQIAGDRQEPDVVDGFHESLRLKPTGRASSKYRVGTAISPIRDRIPAATTWAMSSWSKTKSLLLSRYGIVSSRWRL